MPSFLKHGSIVYNLLHLRKLRWNPQKTGGLGRCFSLSKEVFDRHKLTEVGKSGHLDEHLSKSQPSFALAIAAEWGVSKHRGTPKWMVYNEKPHKMDDLVGFPLFLETPI